MSHLTFHWPYGVIESAIGRVQNNYVGCSFWIVFPISLGLRLFILFVSYHFSQGSGLPGSQLVSLQYWLDDSNPDAELTDRCLQIL